MQQRPRTLMWVRGHQGEKGNEEADRRAREEVEGRGRDGMEATEKCGGYASWDQTRASHISQGATAHLRWSRRALKGLVYMVTDKGPQQQWLYEIGKLEEPWCVCDGWTPQNAACKNTRL